MRMEPTCSQNSYPARRSAYDCHDVPIDNFDEYRTLERYLIHADVIHREFTQVWRDNAVQYYRIRGRRKQLQEAVATSKQIHNFKQCMTERFYSHGHSTSQ